MGKKKNMVPLTRGGKKTRNCWRDRRPILQRSILPFREKIYKKREYEMGEVVGKKRGRLSGTRCTGAPFGRGD